jgi:hypothetical protein
MMESICHPPAGQDPYLVAYDAVRVRNAEISISGDNYGPAMEAFGHSMCEARPHGFMIDVTESLD